MLPFLNSVTVTLDKLTNHYYSNFIDSDIISQHKKYIGEPQFNVLNERFNSESFSFEGTWNQVLTSRSTIISGTGLSSSTVSAIYKKIEGTNKYSVLNTSNNDNLKGIFIRGNSPARDESVPTCRTVIFDSIQVEGNYWICYISEDLETILVVSPIIIPLTSICVIPSFICYVLTKKSHDQFWSDNKFVEEILTETTRLGLNDFYNRPLPTAETLSIDLLKASETTGPFGQL